MASKYTRVATVPPQVAGRPAGGDDEVVGIEFAWDSLFGRCHATAVNARHQLLGELVVDLPDAVRAAIVAARGPSFRADVEDLIGRQLRAVLALRQPPRPPFH